MWQHMWCICDMYIPVDILSLLLVITVHVMFSANLILYSFNYKSIIYYNFVFDANYIWPRDPSGNKLLLSFSGLSQVKAV